MIGANKVLHDQKLYGGWPADNPQGDTYGPFNYYAYVPFTAAFGWSGVWDNLPAAHAAAIAFDLLTMLGLFLLGRSIRGPTLGSRSPTAGRRTRSRCSRCPPTATMRSLR